MGPYQRTPKEVARAISYSGLGVRSVGPVGDFLEEIVLGVFFPKCWVVSSVSGQDCVSLWAKLRKAHIKTVHSGKVI